MLTRAHPVHPAHRRNPGVFAPCGRVPGGFQQIMLSHMDCGEWRRRRARQDGQGEPRNDRPTDSSLPEVEDRTQRSRVQCWRDIKAGKFPAPVQLGPNSVGWFEDEIEAWLAARPRRTYRAKAPEENSARPAPRKGASPGREGQADAPYAASACVAEAQAGQQCCGWLGRGAGGGDARYFWRARR